MQENKDEKNVNIEKNDKTLSAKEFRREMVEIIFLVALAICISLLIITFVGQRTVVRGSSMEPTLHNGDQLIVYKLLYFFSHPQKGDIVVVDVPVKKRVNKSENLYIKRVIATEGETVSVADKEVYVNGQKLTEPNVIKEGYSYVPFPEQVVPKGDVFVLGDNRVNSRDSREIGFIPYSNIKGKAIFRIWPLSTLGNVK